MTVTEFFRICWRWAWVLVPGVVISLGVGALAFTQSQAEYTRSVSYLMLSPVQTEAGPSNPLLQLGNGVSMAASVLAARVTDGDTARALTQDSPDLTYTVGLDTAVQAPLLVVSATDADRGAVDAALDSLGQELVSQLDELQSGSGAPQSTWVTIEKLTEDPEFTVSRVDQWRNGVMVAVADLALFVGLMILLERRRRRTVERAAADPAAVDGAAVATEGPSPAAARGRATRGTGSHRGRGTSPGSAPDAGDQRDADVPRDALPVSTSRA